MRWTCGLVGLVVSGVLAAGNAAAADFVPHTARYRIEQAVTAPRDMRTPGSLTTELNRTCAGFLWTWSMNYTVDRGKVAPGAGEQYEEVLTASESGDGSALDYTMRYRVGARTVTAEGQARFGKGDEPGTLAVKPANLAPDSRIQPHTLPPVALRLKLMDSLAANDRGPWIVQGMELLRFHRSNDYRVELVETKAFPGAQPLPRGTPAQVPVDPNSLLKAKSATLKQTSYQIAEWGDLIYTLHTNGLISRMAFKRNGIDVLAILQEASGFPAPKCN